MNKRQSALLLHSELPVDMTWDLSSLYNSAGAWEKDFKSIDKLVKNVEKFKGHLAESALIMAQAIAAIDDMERLVEKVYVYAHLKADEDKSNSANSAIVDRISSKSAKIAGATAWFEPEFMAIPIATINKFLKSDGLKFYRRSIEELLRERKHTLTEPEERLLGLSADIMQMPYKAFSMLNNADIQFPAIDDGSGKKLRLTHGNYFSLLESPDRLVRKNAFNAMFDTYEKYRNTFAATLDGAVKQHVFSAKIRNYRTSLEAALFEDKIPVPVYDNLISAVKSKLPVLHEYFLIRAKALGLKKLNMYDLFNPLVPECKLKISWNEAKKLVQEAFKPLGGEYVSIVQKAFTERWIDALECKGKRSGAYSSGCYDSFPYILLNYNNTLNDVFTLAHELGHSLHSFYSNKNQPYHYADYSIFVAEVASTTNEILLHEYLMQQQSRRDIQIYLLCHMADEIRGTIFRQTMFAEFEKMLYSKSELDIPLTPDLLDREYLTLNTEYHGKNVVIDPRLAVEWARIPHFYYNFYVYKYATGMSAALKLSKNILSGDGAKLGKYFSFLKAGDSKDVLDIMADAGVDLASSNTISDGLEHFADIVEQLKQLMLLK
jgi:oligoendopeptidase F